MMPVALNGLLNKKKFTLFRYAGDESEKVSFEEGDHYNPGEKVDKIKVSDGEKDKEKKVKEQGGKCNVGWA